MTDPQAVVDALDPGVAALAEHVSLAAKVDPRLLRLARLQLDLPTSAEADVWFSLLVAARSRAGFTFMPDMAQELRGRLASDQPRLAAAWALTEKTHAHLPPTIRLQERVTWLALSGDAGTAGEIEGELESAVTAMRRQERRSRGLARWALAAVPALPERARETRAARRLALGAVTRLRPGTGDGEAPGYLQDVLEGGVPRIDAGVRLTSGGVELSQPPAEGADAVDLPAIPPLAVQLRVAGEDGGRRVAIAAESRVTTALGEVTELVSGRRFPLPDRIERVAFDSDERLYALDASGTLHTRLGKDDAATISRVVHFALGKALFTNGPDGLVLRDPEPRVLGPQLEHVAALSLGRGDVLAIGYADGRLSMRSQSDERIVADVGTPVVDLAWSDDGRRLAVLDANGLATLLSSSDWSPERHIPHGTPAVALAFRADELIVAAGGEVTAWPVLRQRDRHDRLGVDALSLAASPGRGPVALLTTDGECLLWWPHVGGRDRVTQLDVAATARTIAVGAGGAIAVGGMAEAIELETSLGEVHRLEVDDESTRLELDLLALLELLQAIAVTFHVGGLAPSTVPREELEGAFGRGEIMDPEAFDALRSIAEWALGGAADALEAGREHVDWASRLAAAGVPGLTEELDVGESVDGFLSRLLELLGHAQERFADLPVVSDFPVDGLAARRVEAMYGGLPVELRPFQSDRAPDERRRQITLTGPFSGFLALVAWGRPALAAGFERRRELGPPAAAERRRATESLASGDPEERMWAIQRLDAVATRAPEQLPTILRALARFVRDWKRSEAPSVPPAAVDPLADRDAALALLVRRTEASLEPLDLDGADLDLARLAGALLAGASLSGASLQRTDLSRAVLTGASLVNAEGAGTQFDGAAIEAANLAGARLPEASLTGANLSGSNLARARLTRCSLEGARAVGANLAGAQLDGAAASGAVLAASNFASADLSGADLSGADLNGSNLAGASLRDADLRRADLRGTNLAGSELAGAILEDAQVEGANMPPRPPPPPRPWEAARQWAQLLHGDRITALAFSPDGERLATSSMDGSARIWDVNDRRERLRLDHSMEVRQVAFSPDGRHVATVAGDDTVRLWEAADGHELAYLQHDADVMQVAFSPDGRLLAVACPTGMSRIWEIPGGQEAFELAQPKWIFGIAFSPDGRYLATGATDRVVRVWDADGGGERVRLRTDEGLLRVAFSPDGRLLAGATERTAYLWEFETGAEQARLQHEARIRTLAFSPDGRLLATAGDDESAFVWEAATGRETARLDHKGPVADLAFDRAGGLIATAGADGAARVWDAATGRARAVLEHDHAVSHVAFRPGGALLATASAEEARLWQDEPPPAP